MPRSRLRLQPRTYRRITWWALVSLCFIVVTGAAVRLTGSGLGCPDWPSCYENQFHAELSYHPMIEFVNRLITGLVSVAVILAVLGSLVRVPRRRDLTWWSLGLVAGVVAQVVVGAFVVIWKLTPQIVMTHFLLSMILVANATILHVRAGQPDGRRVPRTSVEVRRLSAAIVGAASVAIFTGTVVTGSGPHGGDERVTRLDFHLPDVARVHGISVMLVLAMTLAWLWMAHRERAAAPVMRAGRHLLVVLVAQAAVGYTQYFTGVPVILVAVHVLGATLIMVFAVRLVLACSAVVAPPATVPVQLVDGGEPSFAGAAR